MTPARIAVATALTHTSSSQMCIRDRPQTTYSAHYIADPGLARAIDEYLKRERAYVAEAARELTEAGPFRKAAEEPS